MASVWPTLPVCTWPGSPIASGHDRRCLRGVSVNRLKRYKCPVNTLAHLGGGTVESFEVVWKGLSAQHVISSLIADMEQETRPFPGLR